MPIYKYRTFEEAERSLWNFEPDDKYYKKLHALFALAEGINPVQYPRGLFKYKTLKEAQTQKLEWDIENAVKMEKGE